MQLKTAALKSPEINAIDPMFFIYNLGSISQAGRHGFESRRPLSLNPPHMLIKPSSSPDHLKDYAPSSLKPLRFAGGYQYM